ncbi:MAG: tRNA pseudouridine(13) synthase TruD [Anaerolineae bacterium]|nr:tRNA pseudouridine(13) synthase TruD [Anaerolineae bacterium]
MEKQYLTANLPGIGGKTKVFNADFCVTELPLYTPCGHGQHTYIDIEKEGIPTFEATRRIAKALGIDPRSIGYAGLKDAHAVTVQTLSIEHVLPAEIEKLELPGIRILNVSQHTNKLKIGHLRGNQFTIRVRDVPPGAQPIAQAILDVLAQRGVPNRFGEQRFGVRGDTDLLGRALVLGDTKSFIDRFVGMPHPAETTPIQRARQLYQDGKLKEALDVWPKQMQNERRVVHTLLDRPENSERATRSIPYKMRKFFISAYQSTLFNRLLARRLDAIDRLVVGDLAWIHDKGAVFDVQDPEIEQPRADALEISPSGPLFGFKMTMPKGVPGEMEQHILDQESLTLDDWRAAKFKGARRPLRFPLRESKIWYDDGLMISFVLPPGCYATVVLDEIMKSPRVTA